MSKIHRIKLSSILSEYNLSALTKENVMGKARDGKNRRVKLWLLGTDKVTLKQPLLIPCFGDDFVNGHVSVFEQTQTKNMIDPVLDGIPGCYSIVPDSTGELTLRIMLGSMAKVNLRMDFVEKPFTDTYKLTDEKSVKYTDSELEIVVKQKEEPPKSEDESETKEEISETPESPSSEESTPESEKQEPESSEENKESEEQTETKATAKEDSWFEFGLLLNDLVDNKDDYSGLEASEKFKQYIEDIIKDLFNDNKELIIPKLYYQGFVIEEDDKTKSRHMLGTYFETDKYDKTIKLEFPIELAHFVTDKNFIIDENLVCTSIEYIEEKQEPPEESEGTSSEPKFVNLNNHILPNTNKSSLVGLNRTKYGLYARESAAKDIAYTLSQLKEIPEIIDPSFKYPDSFGEIGGSPSNSYYSKDLINAGIASLANYSSRLTNYSTPVTGSYMEPNNYQEFVLFNHAIVDINSYLYIGDPKNYTRITYLEDAEFDKLLEEKNINYHSFNKGSLTITKDGNSDNGYIAIENNKASLSKYISESDNVEYINTSFREYINNLIESGVVSDWKNFR